MYNCAIVCCTSIFISVSDDTKALHRQYVPQKLRCCDSPLCSDGKRSSFQSEQNISDNRQYSTIILILNVDDIIWDVILQI